MSLSPSFLAPVFPFLLPGNALIEYTMLFASKGMYISKKEEERSQEICVRVF